MNYIRRNIDSYLIDWKNEDFRKPLLVRGARQVGKSWAIRHLGESFKYFIEINLEKQPEYIGLFKDLADVKEIANRISAMTSIPVEPGNTLLFIDEIQFSSDAIKKLRYFKEDYPELHVAAAGSLLEFALAEIQSYGVGRITSFFMYPFSFEEFLYATGKEAWVKVIRESGLSSPVFQQLHYSLIELWRSFILIGGMPEVVASWVKHQNYLQCFRIQEDIKQSYLDDFEKYSKKIDPILLRNTLMSAVAQTGRKFVFSRLGEGYRVENVKKAVTALCMAGLLIEINLSAANGVPLGAEVNPKFRKYVCLDTGIMLRIQGLNEDINVSELIMNSTPEDLVNKGAIAEMYAGLEFIKHSNPRMTTDLYYWENLSKGSSAEVDYVAVYRNKILPIEIKSGTSGKMKSLRMFMDARNLITGVRSSLENFGRLSYQSDNAERHIAIIPLYALPYYKHYLPQAMSD